MSVKTTAHIGSDGMLTIAVPKPRQDTAVEAVVALQPLPTEHSWPAGFFEMTYGSLQYNPIERGPQGEYEQHEELASTPPRMPPS